MSDINRPDSDPSMDDILASIRKIISDDEARAQAGNQGARSAATDPPAQDAARAGRSGAAATQDDVLLLTDLIEDSQSEPSPVRAAPIPLPRIDPTKASEMPQPNVEPAVGASAPASDSPLIGAAVAGATSSAFGRLSQAVKQNAPGPAPGSPGPILGASGKTIEDLVKEMLRPMLKEWIDKNLPPMVERLVEREIARLTRG